MLGSIPFAPEQASSMAGQVDALYLYLLGITIFFSVLIAALIFFFAVKYRRRDPGEIPRPVEGSIKLETAWSAIPFLIMMTIFAWATALYFKERRPPDDAMEIFVVAKQWMWKFQHSEGQREINELHVPLGRNIRLRMTTEDVIHAFYVPAFRIQYDVVPGRYTDAWFQPTKTGKFHLFCAEYCGMNHAGMRGYVIVQTPEEYQAWLNGGGGGSPAEEGQALFQSLGCATCHRLDVQGRCPNLKGLFGTPVKLDTGDTVMADEDYIRESIVNSQAKIVAGYQRPSIMPVYQGQVNEDQVLQLIAYIKSLGSAQGTAGGTGTSATTGALGTTGATQAPAGQASSSSLIMNPVVSNGTNGPAPSNAQRNSNQ